MYSGRESWMHEIPLNTTAQPDIRSGYKWRQLTFMTSCTRALKQEGHSWVTLIDSDEYLGFNQYRHNEGPATHCGMLPKNAKPARRKKWLRTHNLTKARQCVAEFRETIRNRTHARGLLPNDVGNTTISDFIATYKDAVDPFYVRYCIMVPRVGFGAIESDPFEVQNQVPTELNASTFHTLRYRHHDSKRNSLPGKSLVDVSRYRVKQILDPHRVLGGGGSTCGSSPFPVWEQSLFRIHHYSGSLELFLSRPGDTRRGPENFHWRNNYTSFGASDELRPWIKLFCDQVGIPTAKMLTQDLKEWAFRSDAAISSTTKATK